MFSWLTVLGILVRPTLTRPACLGHQRAFQWMVEVIICTVIVTGRWICFVVLQLFCDIYGL